MNVFFVVVFSSFVLLTYLRVKNAVNCFLIASRVIKINMKHPELLKEFTNFSFHFLYL